MALNWDISRVKDHETVCFVGEGDKRRMHGTTETLIWATMIFGQNSITEKNWEEFLFRAKFYERLNGGLRTDWSGGEPRPVCLTADEIKAHIGLGTNATNYTRAAWIKNVIKNFDRDCRAANRQEAEAAVS